MALSERQIKKLSQRAESLMTLPLDDLLRRQVIASLKEALGCLDTIIRNAPSGMRVPYVSRFAEALCLGLSYLPWVYVIPCDSCAECRRNEEAVNCIVPADICPGVLSSDEVNQLVQKAQSFLNENKWQDALCWYDTIIRYSSPVAHYYMRRALCRCALNDRNGAVDDMDRAISLDPDRAEFHDLRARFRPVRESSVGTTAQDYRAALQKNPTLASAWMGLIEHAMLTDDWDEVISLCGQSRPYVTDAHDKAVRAWVLCLALIHAGDPVSKEDIEPMKRASDIHSSSIGRISDHVHQQCENAKVSKEMLTQIRSVNEMLVDRLGDLSLSCSLCIRWGYWDKALQILDVRLKRDPQDADALFKKADILYERFGRAEEALELYDTAIVLGRPQGSDMQVWASRLRRHKRCKKALDLLCEFTRTSQYPGTWLEIGECLIEMGQYDEAMASVEKAMGYAPTNRHAWLLRGQALEAMGRNEEALKAYEKAAEPNPDDWYSSDRPDRNMWAPYALSSRARLLNRLSGGDRATASTE